MKSFVRPIAGLILLLSGALALLPTLAGANPSPAALSSSTLAAGTPSAGSAAAGPQSAVHAGSPNGRAAQVSWTLVSTGVNATLYAVASNLNGDVIAVGTSGTVVRSADDGVTWTLIDAGVSSAFTLRAVAFSDPSNVWIAGDGGTLFHSTDAGLTWYNQSVVDTNGVPPAIYSLTFTSPTTGYFSGEEAVQAGGGFIGVIFQTTDGGQTWQSETLPSPYSALWNALAFNSSGVGLAVNSDGNIMRTTDGVSWTYVYEPGPVNSEPLFDVAFAPDQTDASAVGFANTILQSPDSGQTWNPATPAAGTAVFAYYQNVAYMPGTSGFGVAVGAQNGPLIVDTADSGMTWTMDYPSSQLNRPSGAQQGSPTVLNGVACNTTSCVAVGDQGGAFTYITAIPPTPQPTTTGTSSPTQSPVSGTSPTATLTATQSPVSGASPTPTITLTPIPPTPMRVPRLYLPDVPGQASNG